MTIYRHIGLTDNSANFITISMDIFIQTQKTSSYKYLDNFVFLAVEIRDLTKSLVKGPCLLVNCYIKINF